MSTTTATKFARLAPGYYRSEEQDGTYYEIEQTVPGDEMHEVYGTGWLLVEFTGWASEPMGVFDTLAAAKAEVAR